MNRQPFQAPPRWWSPKLSPFWVRAWRPLRLGKQRREEGIEEIQVRGLEHVKAAVDEGHGILITPNHPGHGDCYVLLDAADRLGQPFYFLTAWQVFAVTGRLGRLVMQQHGCFSIDREGTDLRAFRQAVDILQDSAYPLVIHPEGEVYHLNDRITPFREGTAAIALSAAKRSKRSIVCVPCAIKYQYLEDPTPALTRLMDRLEQAIFWRPCPELPLVDRVYRFAEGALALKEVEYMGRTASGALSQRIAGLCNGILDRVEQRYGMATREATLPERVKELRHHAITEMERAESHQARQQFAEDLDDLFLVVQLFSYQGDYLVERPSIERLAETLDKLEEDVLGVPTAGTRAPRRGVVWFGEPLTVARGGRKKEAVAELTRILEQRVQSLIDNFTFAEEPVAAPEAVVSR